MWFICAFKYNFICASVIVILLMAKPGGNRKIIKITIQFFDEERITLPNYVTLFNF